MIKYKRWKETTPNQQQDSPTQHQPQAVVALAASLRAVVAPVSASRRAAVALVATVSSRRAAVVVASVSSRRVAVVASLAARSPVATLAASSKLESD